MGRRLLGRFGPTVFIGWLLTACAPEVGVERPSAVERASEALKRTYEPVLVALEAELSATDWRTLSGTEAQRGASKIELGTNAGPGVAFQRRWFSAERGRAVGFSVAGQSGQIPLVAVYGPDKYAVARRVAFTVGVGTPSHATIKVSPPADGRYLLVVADARGMPEPMMSSADGVGPAGAYLEEAPSCECPCENTVCDGDGIWAVDEEGNKTELLKTCDAGECVDVTEGGPAHAECIDRTACCEGGGLCEVDDDGNEKRKLRPQADCVVCTNGTSAEGKPRAMCETAREHCTGLNDDGCAACEDDRWCHMCGGLCTPNEAETNSAGAMCIKVSEGAERHCDGDDEPDAGTDDDEEVEPTDKPPGTMAARVIVPTCGGYDAESSCRRNDFCGWCADGAGACVLGSEEGPDSGTCSAGNWSYGL